MAWKAFLLVVIIYALYKYLRILSVAKQNKEFYDNKIHNIEQIIENLIKEKTTGFPWLAEAIADYMALQDGKVMIYLKMNTSRPTKSMKAVKTLTKEKQILAKQLSIATRIIKYYETVFPFLSDFKEAEIDDLLSVLEEKNKSQKDDEEDPVRDFMTEGEFKVLSVTERNQRALDRYFESSGRSLL